MVDALSEDARERMKVSPLTKEPDISMPLGDVAKEYWRYRHHIAAVTAVLCLAAVSFAVIRPLRFVSSSAFSVQAPDLRRLSGLAAQVGLSLPSGDGQQSPAYYMELVLSHDILARLASARYLQNRATHARGVTLREVYKVDEKDSAIAQDLVVRTLRRAIDVSKSRESGIVSISVTTSSAPLAQEMDATLLTLLTEFGVKTRQSQAGNERTFIEQRIVQATAELRAAEERFADFLQRNRAGVTSVPELMLQRDRLQRDIALRQQVYTSLMQSYEQARIDEIRSTPALTIVEAPSLPARRESRHVALFLAIAFVGGLAISGFVIALRLLFLVVPEEGARVSPENG